MFNHTMFKKIKKKKKKEKQVFSMPRYYIGQLFDRMDVIPETDLGYLTAYATGKI